MPEALRCFPSRPPPQFFTGLVFPAIRSFMKRWFWSARNPGQIRSLVTTKIAPQCRVSLYSQECLDPCAKGTVLRVLSGFKKGKRKFDG